MKAWGCETNDASCVLLCHAEFIKESTGVEAGVG